MFRWSNRIFAIIALLLILYVFAQDRDRYFKGMKQPEQPAQTEPQSPPQTKSKEGAQPIVLPEQLPESPETAAPQESVDVREVKTVPAKEPVSR